MSSKGEKKKYGEAFNDELDAAKRDNQLCEEMGIPHKNPGINAIPNQQRQPKRKASQYNGVHWFKPRDKWSVVLCLQEGKRKFGGFFNDELDAAKRVNQLCEKIGIPYKNPGINAKPNQQWPPKQKTSQYKEVYWSESKNKWWVVLSLQGTKNKFGGYFDDELDAAKRLNQLCEEFGIPHKNYGIGTIINQQPKQKISQYTGVCWHKRQDKWSVDLCLQGVKKKFGGYFNDELDAAKRINQLCEEFGIPHKNHGIGTIINQETKQTSSQYTGVSRNTANGKWRARLYLQGRRTKNGGNFSDELDAAKRINQLCEQFDSSQELWNWNDDKSTTWK